MLVFGFHSRHLWYVISLLEQWKTTSNRYPLNVRIPFPNKAILQSSSGKKYVAVDHKGRRGVVGGCSPLSWAKVRSIRATFLKEQ